MSPSNYDEDQMERFLDGLMSDDEAAEFTSSIDPAELEAALELEQQLSDSLRTVVSSSQLNEQEILRAFNAQHAVEVSREPEPSRSGLSRSRLIQIALVACVLIAVGLAIWLRPGNSLIEPIFTQQPLAMIYHETVDRGFRPAYNCEEPQRFADTFERNHGQALALADLPTGSRMLGLSTLGGMSRSTVAMLCEVDGENVIVFVDRVGKGDTQLAKQIKQGSKLNVFVEERDGLIFFEVTPLDSAKMIQHFRFLD